MEQSMRMAHIAYDALSDKMGEDIKIIDISRVSVLADYFVIANGTSDSQVTALIDNVDQQMAKAGFQIKQQEGYGKSTWVLMDYGDVIVHVFDKEGRSFYNLERIWRDGTFVK